MCIFPSAHIDTSSVSKEETVTDENSAAAVLEKDKNRKGYQSTIATSGMGISEKANVLKKQLGS